MRFFNFSIVSILVMCIFFASCFKDPAGPDISGDLKPKGSISGWIFTGSGSPLKDVIVSIDSDTATPGISDSTGKFKVGNVLPGTYTLHFSHIDYEDNPSHTVTLEQGVDDTIKDTVFLSYKYFILKGKVMCGGSPVVMAGVVVDNLLMSTVTNSNGYYLFEKVRKENNFKIICAKTDVGYGLLNGIQGIIDDTTIIPDIELIHKGGTVKGTVYDTLGRPIPFAVVHSVSGGLIDTATVNGTYTITNMPYNAPTIPIYVPEINGLTGSISGLNINTNGILIGINIYLRSVSDYVNGMKIIASDILVPDTVTKVDISVIGITDGNSYITEYEWYLKSGAVPDTITPSSYFTLTLKELMQFVTGKAANDTDVLVEVRAKNNNDLFSQKEKFFLKFRSFKPVIKTEIATHPDSSGKDTITVMINQTVYMRSVITVLFGGIDTLEWDFGDSTVKIISPDSIENITHSYNDSGTYIARLRLIDTNGKEAKDTVVVIVQDTIIPPCITEHPKPATVLTGQAASFNITATGTSPLSYQWLKNDTLITGATDTSYTTPATTLSDSGSLFCCIVSNAAGSDTSNTALLIVSQNITPPTITSHPLSKTVVAGHGATFSIVATGTAPLTYQWQTNDTNITGATNVSYTIPVTTMEDDGKQFRCIVSNSAGKDTSNYATLSIKNIPVIQYDTVINSSISSNGEIDSYSFDGTSGDLITIRTDDDVGGGFSSKIELYGPTDTLLIQDASQGQAYIVDFKLPENGRYIIYIMENGGGATANYWMTLQCRTELNITAPTIQYDTAINEVTEKLGDIDAFTFNGTSGDLITIRMDDDVGGDFSSRIELYGPSDTLLKFDAHQGQANIVDYSLPETGRHVIYLMADGGGITGNYWVTLQCKTVLKNNAPVIQYDTTINNVTEKLGDIDAFAFDGTIGDVITILMDDDVGGAFSSRFELYGPADTLLQVASHQGQASIIDYSLPENGRYVIYLMADGGGITGNYWMSLQCRIKRSAISRQSNVKMMSY